MGHIRFSVHGLAYGPASLAALPPQSSPPSSESPMPFRQHSHNLLGVEDDDPSSDFDDAGPQLMKPVPQDEAKIDHRKKRRNRTTQSCLSCHQNKRKVRLIYRFALGSCSHFTAFLQCDRGRPCGRCITLGLVSIFRE